MSRPLDHYGRWHLFRLQRRTPSRCVKSWRAVERGVGDKWLGRVSGLVAKEVVATYAAANAGFGKLGSVNVEVQDYVTGAVADGGVGVERRII